MTAPLSTVGLAKVLSDLVADPAGDPLLIPASEIDLVEPEPVPVVAAGHWPTNAELIADVARVGYLRREWLTLDPTYGRGLWWKKWSPDTLHVHDITLDGVDFRSMPHDDDTYDAVAFDPPYVCVDEETEILTSEGWKPRADLRPDEVVLTLDHGAGVSRWETILGIVDFPAERRRMLSMESKTHSSLTTMEHRWPVLRRRRSGAARSVVPEWATSGSLLGDDRVPISAPHVGFPTSPVHSDAFVELVGWFWTEGSLDRGRDGLTGFYGNVCQGREVNASNCERIRRAFTEEFGPDAGPFPRLGKVSDGVPRWREVSDGHKQVWWFSVDLGARLVAQAPGRVPTMAFLLSLTRDQLALFIEVSMLADGHTRQGARSLGQKNRAAADAFQVAAVLAGHAPSILEGGEYQHRGGTSTMHTVRLRTAKTFRVGQQNPSVVDHDGPVWCVTTPSSTWLARRRGKVWWTGNCTGGRTTTGLPEFYARYGLTDAPRTPAQLQELMNDGLAEVARVLRPGGFVLMKCQDYVSSGKLWNGTFRTQQAAFALGLTQVDRFEHISGVGAQPKGRRQVHARRNNSTLFIFQTPKRRRRRVP